MKTLNRPMFKNGGPIKEGIMSGMKDGGSLSPQFNTGLVGDERYPKTGGRENHAVFLAPLAYQGLMAAGRFLAPRAIAAAGRAFGTGLRTGAPGTSPFASGITKMQRLRNLLPTGRFRNTQVASQGNVLTPAQIAAGMKPTIGKMSARQVLRSPEAIGKAVRENPATAFLAAGQIKNIPDIVSGGAGLAKDALLGGTNYLLGTEFGKNKTPKETGDGKKLEIVDNIKTVPNADTGADSKSDAEKDKINEDRINETKKKYYKLMGIDKMNKNAAYDSLIDASKIVQEEGGDLKGSIKSGNLQNRIIQAISGNLDKSADLKKQIDAAVLKGEISKDIEKSKLDAFDKQLKVLGVDGYRKKSLGLTSVAEDINLQNISGKSIPTSNSVASTIIAKGTGVNGILPDDKYQKWEKANEGKSELNYIQENFSGLDDGLYVVNKKAVQVKDGQIAFVDLDSIIG